jgi:methionyl-tRNA formyltransferase
MESKRSIPMARIIFFGNERLSSGYKTTAPTLSALIEAGHDICAVVANYEAAKSRNSRELEIKTVADAHGIPVLLPNKPAEIIDQLRAYGADIGVLVAYGRIVPQSVIDVFPHGIVNIHPSLLPQHRGSIPIEAAMLGGTEETGVSLMQLVKAMDAGPVYKQVIVELNGNETKQALTDRLLNAGKDALIECLPAILDGSLQPTPQDDSKATYDNLLSSADSILDFNKSALQLEREVRAYAEWPKSRTTLAGKDVVVTQARVGQRPAGSSLVIGSVFVTDDKDIGIQTSSGVLVVEKLKPAGKQEMAAQAFLAGNKLQ